MRIIVSRSVDILVRYIQYHAMATLYGEESGSSFLSTGRQTEESKFQFFELIIHMKFYLRQSFLVEKKYTLNHGINSSSQRNWIVL